MSTGTDAAAIGLADSRQLEEVTVAMGRFAPASGPAWFLSGQGDETAKFRYAPLTSFPFRVGRRSDLSLCLPFPTISGLHAEIRQRDENLFLQDMGSTNGTFVNGQRVGLEVELAEGDLVQFANIAFRINRENERAETHTVHVDVCEDALALSRFDDLINERAVVPHFQPLVRHADEAVFGYEILGRSRLFGLKNPREMFRVAAQLNLEAELSRMLRLEGIQSGAKLTGNPALFVNTHPLELSAPAELHASLEKIRELHSELTIVVEIHEAAVLKASIMKDLRSFLRSLDMQLAYDDFGAGQARLVELVDVVPDYLKFDLTLVQNIHQASAQHQQMVAALVRMATELGIATIAEGIECEVDSNACRQLGFQIGQGFFYGKPAPASTYRRTSDGN